MYVIESIEEINAVSGGRIQCTAGNKGVSYTGSGQEWGDLLFGAFDQLQSWGSDLGVAIYDWTH